MDKQGSVSGLICGREALCRNRAVAPPGLPAGVLQEGARITCSALQSVLL